MGRADELFRLVEHGYGPVAGRAAVVKGLCRMAKRGDKKAYDYLVDIAADGHQNRILRGIAQDWLEKYLASTAPPS